MKLIKRTLAFLAVLALLLTGCAPAAGPEPNADGSVLQPTQPTTPTNPTLDPPATPTLPLVPDLTLTPLSTAWKQQVEEDWTATTGTDLGDWYDVQEDNDGIRYYGTYGGYDILFMPGRGEAETQLEIENMTFEHHNTFEIYAYREGSFTPIKELSGQGKLTTGNLVELLAVHRSYGRTSIGDRTPPVLTADTLELMKLTFLKAYDLTEKYTTADLSVVYYGQYGEAHVGFFNGIMGYTQALTSDTVGGVTFRYTTGQKLQVVWGGQLLSLKEAYEQGHLTREDLVTIRNRLNPPTEDNLVTE